ncbi:DUF4396 domain-containing protein [Nocardioides aurantiacus]|uniref:Uncharacterized protein DUF4396 n=1 Tax=Nocardioides aurantiacus TaxID=86796 RepID=A0A3N2CWM0_9ACTN|nr:DUF4396 domain-containing protein [Nocardioides aurantiacus]ROR91873.1 uncharacterized protein DUF4396 [Nocardioides aurantiacus]
MQMVDRVPDWVTPVAWIYIALSVAAAAWIALDVRRDRRRHASVASELVWVASGLYLGPFAVPLHRRRGRDDATTSAAVAGLPGGGASAVAHLVGVPLVLLSGLTIAGIDLWVMIIVIGIIAMLLLFAYERAATPAGAATTGPGRAAVAAVVTVLAFDVGMGGWMLLLHVTEYMPPATEGSFWFLMQVGIILGLVTGYPAVRWLQRQRLAATPAV